MLPDDEHKSKLESVLKEQMPEYMRLFQFTTKDAFERDICAKMGLAFSPHQSYACGAPKRINRGEKEAK